MAGPSGPSKKKNVIFTKTSSGSLQPELRYLAIGRVIRAHGIKGEISVSVLTDFPERFETMEWVYLGNEFEATAYHLEKHRWHKKNALLTFAGITDRDQAEQLKGQFVQVPIEEAMPLPEGSYYLYQLMGLQVITVGGNSLGSIADIIETGANDVYIIKKDGRQELLLPAIPDVVKSIDIEQGHMIVELIDGLI